MQRHTNMILDLNALVGIIDTERTVSDTLLLLFILYARKCICKMPDKRRKMHRTREKMKHFNCYIHFNFLFAFYFIWKIKCLDTQTIWEKKKELSDTITNKCGGFFLLFPVCVCVLKMFRFMHYIWFRLTIGLSLHVT